MHISHVDFCPCCTAITRLDADGYRGCSFGWRVCKSVCLIRLTGLTGCSTGLTGGSRSDQFGRRPDWSCLMLMHVAQL